MSGLPTTLSVTVSACPLATVTPLLSTHVTVVVECVGQEPTSRPAVVSWTVPPTGVWISAPPIPMTIRLFASADIAPVAETVNWATYVVRALAAAVGEVLDTVSPPTAVPAVIVITLLELMNAGSDVVDTATDTLPGLPTLVTPSMVTRTLWPPGIDAPVLNTHVTSLLPSSRVGQLPTVVPAVVSSMVPATVCVRSFPFGNETLIWLFAAAERSDPAGRSNVVT